MTQSGHRSWTREQRLFLRPRQARRQRLWIVTVPGEPLPAFAPGPYSALIPKTRSSLRKLGLLGFAERSKAMTEVAQQTGSDKTAIRPFQVNFPDAELTELRRRVNATRWPE